jgi:hypothetical protein
MLGSYATFDQLSKEALKFVAELLKLFWRRADLEAVLAIGTCDAQPRLP